MGGYYNRNAKIKSYLEIYTDELPPREDMVLRLELVADIIDKMEFSDSSMWWNKANFFTLVVEMFFADMRGKVNLEATKGKISNFESNVPEEYTLAAREGVNNKLERSKRAIYVENLIVVDLYAT